MQIILFSKMFKEMSPEELAEQGVELGIEGYDLAVRPDYPVNPDNAADELPRAVEVLKQAGLSVPMITGNFDLLEPDHPTAEPILSAMAKAGVGHVKLGYFKYQPHEMDYWAEVDRIRRAFEGWEKLAGKYGVKVCYHTHSNRCMGLNAGMLMHLLKDFDPACLGAYLDTAHLCVEGEEFGVAVEMVREYLSLVALKDVLLKRVEKNNHGGAERIWTIAGEGMCDFTNAFEELKRVGYDGPISVHCEFKSDEEKFPALVKREVAFFKDLRDKIENS